MATSLGIFFQQGALDCSGRRDVLGVLGFLTPCFRSISKLGLPSKESWVQANTSALDPMGPFVVPRIVFR
jgi:hypothetical protein